MDESLSPQQSKAVNHFTGALLIVAGAGSGKTRVVTFRIASLLKRGVHASQILALTFTNKAAQEMQRRIHTLTQAFVWTSTFHSLGAKILRESISFLGFSSNFTIFDEEDSEKLLKECVKEKGIKEDRAFVKNLRLSFSQAKNQLLSELPREEDPVAAELFEKYQAKLKACEGVDFDDLLYLTVKLLQNFPEVLEKYQARWHFICIDEYQDTNHAQHMLVKLLAGDRCNVFAVGDPDQSIYSWRGANIFHILDFAKEFPGAQQVLLEQNFRSREHILQGANGLITNNRNRFEKNLWSKRGPGEKVGLCLCREEEEEIAFIIQRLRKHRLESQIPFHECAIFYRTHFQSRALEDGLLRERIPYEIVGGLSFYMRKEVKDLLAFMRIALSDKDAIAFLRTLPLLTKGIGDTTVSHLQNFANEHGLDLFRAARQLGSGPAPFKVSQKQLQNFQHYCQTILRLREKLKGNPSIFQFLKEVIEESAYTSILRSDPESFEDRMENVKELLSTAARWEEKTENPSLPLFLEELSLKSTQDQSPNPDAIKLMTLHNAKGLEFRLCFLVGMEEELFPHANSLDKFDAIEEERRLCYVGMTRAKDFLYLSTVSHRFLWGSPRLMRPSRFLEEIPEENLYTFPFRSSSYASRGR